MRSLGWGEEDDEEDDDFEVGEEEVDEEDEMYEYVISGNASFPALLLTPAAQVPRDGGDGHQERRG